MYFWETVIFICGGLFIGFIGFFVGKKSSDSYKQLKKLFSKNKDK
ncbi:MAG: hypothetical protein RR847_03680 [Bacilli bacterium]